MILFLPPVESAQAVYDRLQTRLAPISWVEFDDFSLAETNYWTEYRIERPSGIASTHHTVFSISETDGKRTTWSEGRNRLALPGDIRTPPGWESLVGKRGNPFGEARETEDDVEIDLLVDRQRYVLKIDRETGLPKGYLLVNEGSVPHDLLEFGYGKVTVHAEPPTHPIHVAEPMAWRQTVAPFRAWLRRRQRVRLTLIQNMETGEDRKAVELNRRERLPQNPIPGFEPIAGLDFHKAQPVGIRWFDNLHEAYVMRSYAKDGWTDVYYSTVVRNGIHFPVGYERYVGGKRTERMGVEVEG